MEEATDAELVQRIGQPGPLAAAAEAQLCRRYALRVQLYGRKHLRDDDAARDLAQTVLVGVLEAARAGRIEDPQRLDRFVLGTCRNSVARLRQQAARVPLASEAALAALSCMPLDRVQIGALLNCLRGLEMRASQVIMLSFLEECSADEIASRFAITAANVRVIRHRALAAIRKCLDDGAAPS